MTLRGLPPAMIQALDGRGVAHTAAPGPALSVTLDTPRGRITLASN